MNSIARCFSFFILLLAMFTSCISKEEKKIGIVTKKDSLALYKELGAVFTKNELMGMSLLLKSGGQLIWQGYYGNADIARDIPITENTIYRVASISKTITATALMQLWEKNKVDLDIDVSAYLGWSLKHPKFPDTPITLRHLLSHQSGIRDGEGYGRFSKDMISHKLDSKELFLPNGSYFTEDQFADHAPGAYFSYTNCTWGLIAAIIEKVSQQRFDDYCRKHIFEPMGLKADFNASKLANLDSLAVLYRYFDEKWTPQVDDYKGIVPKERSYDGYKFGQNGLLFGPQGSLRSSAKDLAAFSAMFMQDGNYNEHQILEKATVDMMLKSHWSYNGHNGDTWDNFFLSYGFGTHQTLNKENGDILFPDRKMVGHPGIAYGLLSDMYFEKDKNSSIIFITNGSKKEFEYGDNTSFYAVEEDIFETVYPFLKTIENNMESKNQ